jgi:SAM-dependent methyltransferase
MSDANHKTSVPEAEFDRHSSNYHALLAESLGRQGQDLDHYAAYKVEDVASMMAREALPCEKILDFGAGVGTSVPHFLRLMPTAKLICADVSATSLDIAQARFGSAVTCHHLDTDADALPFADDSFDVVFVACVFHHIPAGNHLRWLTALRRVLRPTGRLFLFEHNPLNPLTCRVVARCPFDADAVLIRASEMRRRLHTAGFGAVQRRYRLFFPDAMRALRPLENYFDWCALGAQYSLIARK